MYLKNNIIDWLRNLLEDFGIMVGRTSTYEYLYYHKAMTAMLCKHGHAAKTHNALESSYIEYCVNSYPYSYSQRGQDLFALWANQKQNGEFLSTSCVEFGAGNGKHISNTYLLSKNFMFKALLIEPSGRFFKKLIKNQKNDHCIHAAVMEEGMKNGEVCTFIQSGLYSHRVGLGQTNDIASQINQTKTGEFTSKVVDLNTSMEAAFGKEVNNIAYLSADTEGSELEILKTINFCKFTFNAITVECEAEYPEREKNIVNLLETKGYSRIFDRGITGVDLWFIPKNHWRLQ